MCVCVRACVYGNQFAYPVPLVQSMPRRPMAPCSIATSPAPTGAPSRSTHPGESTALVHKLQQRLPNPAHLHTHTYTEALPPATIMSTVCHLVKPSEHSTDL